MYLGRLGGIIDSNLQIPPSFPYDMLDRHVVALAIDDVRVNESGIAAKVSVSIQALLDFPPLKAKRAGEDVPHRTEVKEFKGVVQLQARGKIEDLEDFDNLEFVPPAVLLSWPKDL